MSYLAVHLGTATIDIAPADSTIQPVHLTVKVVKPSRLGLDPWELDDAIVAQAHERGIPPQYVKGQIRQEQAPKGRPGARHFDVVNFRYEPCGVDYVSISKGETLIANAPYSTYKLDDAIKAGTLVPNRHDDLDYRNNLFIYDKFDSKGNPTHYRPLTDSDTGITASALWLANKDSKSDPPPTTPGKQGWAHFCKYTAEFKKDPKLLDFIAQTPTASTFGLFQIEYQEAITNGWSGVALDPANPTVRSQNPKYLMDRPEYVAIGGGSMDKGLDVDVRKFFKTMSSQKVCGKYQHEAVNFPPYFADLADFEKYLALAIRGYNCAITDPTTRKTYGDSVIYYSHFYLPVQGNIF